MHTPKDDSHLLHRLVPADDGDSRGRSGMEQRAVPDEMPLAELRKLCADIIREARREIHRAESAKSSAAIPNFYYWQGCLAVTDLIAKSLRRPSTARGIGGNETSPSTGATE
jgi:hypothetical protein